jgi:hypothetical protein
VLPAHRRDAADRDQGDAEQQDRQRLRDERDRQDREVTDKGGRDRWALCCRGWLQGGASDVMPLLLMCVVLIVRCRSGLRSWQAGGLQQQQQRRQCL